MKVRKFIKGQKFLVGALAVFLLLVTVFDRNNLVNSMKLYRKIVSLEQERDFYLRKIEEDSTALEMLKDKDYLERFARENYYMKRSEETIYIVR